MLCKWWVPYWEKFLSPVNAFYQGLSWNRFDRLKEALWCDRTKREDLPDSRTHPDLVRTADLSMAFSTANNEQVVFNCWRPSSTALLETGSRPKSAFLWAVQLLRVENQSCFSPCCCSASLKMRGSAFYYECDIVCAIGNRHHFNHRNTWVICIQVWITTDLHTDTCSQVLK